MKRDASDVWFFALIAALSATLVLLVAAMLFANVWFVSPSDFRDAFSDLAILASIRLTLLTCTASAILSIWVATPLAYALSRFKFPGRRIVEVLVDIPLVLPPLVVGLSLLILFHLPIRGGTLEGLFSGRLGFSITYHWPAIVLAQFCVASAFATRMMRATFEQMNRRGEDIARTLGCNHRQAFMNIALPQAGRGIAAATTIAWARSLGEFGPILVFAGATRMKTEVLSTSVFLELSVGDLGSAVAVSLGMVAIAVAVVLLLRTIAPENPR